MPVVLADPVDAIDATVPLQLLREILDDPAALDYADTVVLRLVQYHGGERFRATGDWRLTRLR